MFKNSILTATFISIISATYSPAINAAVVDANISDKLSLDISTNNDEKFAAFQNNQGLYLLFSGDRLKVNLGDKAKAEWNIKEIITLDVTGGSGIKLIPVDPAKFTLSNPVKNKWQLNIGSDSLKDLATKPNLISVIVNGNEIELSTLAGSESIEFSDESVNYKALLVDSLASLSYSHKLANGGEIISSLNGAIFTLPKGVNLSPVKPTSVITAKPAPKPLKPAKPVEAKAPVKPNNVDIEKLKQAKSPSLVEKLLAQLPDIFTNKIEKNTKSSAQKASENLAKALKQVESVHVPSKLQQEFIQMVEEHKRQKELNKPSESLDNIASLNPHPNPKVRSEDLAEGVSNRANKSLPIHKKTASIVEPKSLSASKAALNSLDIFLPNLGVGKLSYHEQVQKTLRRLINARTPQQKDEQRLKLAQINLIFSRPHEAIGWVNSMTTDSNGQPQNDSGKFTKAVSLSLIGRFAEAQKAIKNTIKPEGHNKIWQAFIMANVGEYKKALPLFKNVIDVSSTYPEYMWKALNLSYGDVLLENKNFVELTEHMGNMADHLTTTDLMPEMTLLLAKASIAKKEQGEATRLLAEAAASHDPQVAHNAQYEFVAMLLENNELVPSQAIEHLEDLKFLWRGDDLERKVLHDLGFAYLNQGNLRESLAAFKYYITYFPDAPNRSNVADVMAETFKKAFTPQQVSNMDDLAVLGIYYDFRELTPAGEKGDALISRIGQRLVKLGMIDRAINLFEHQLKSRPLSQLEKAYIGLKLAELYYQDFDYNNGLDALKRTYYAEVPVELASQRQLISAKLYMGDDNFAASRKILRGISLPQARELEAEVAWKSEDYASLTNSRLAGDSPAGKLRQAFSLHQQNDALTLRELAKKEEVAFKEAGYQPLVSFLLEDIGEDSTAVAGDVSKFSSGVEGAAVQMASYNEFKESYEKQQSMRAEEQRRRRLFNNSLRQYTP